MHESKPKTRTHHPEVNRRSIDAPGKQPLAVQLKKSVRGMSFAEGNAALSPDRFTVQRAGGAHQQADGIKSAAAHGVQGAGQQLPHLDTIQKSFGQHDVSSVQARVGGAAADASKSMGADAYTTGNHVAFKSSPDLHTAAHEAAHVVQQRAGVQLKGGVGQTGDAYERQANAVADAVVSGKSTVGLLDAQPSSGVSTAGAVQKKGPAKKKGTHSESDVAKNVRLFLRAAASEARQAIDNGLEAMEADDFPAQDRTVQAGCAATTRHLRTAFRCATEYVDKTGRSATKTKKVHKALDHAYYQVQSLVRFTEIGGHVGQGPESLGFQVALMAFWFKEADGWKPPVGKAEIKRARRSGEKAKLSSSEGGQVLKFHLEAARQQMSESLNGLKGNMAADRKTVEHAVFGTEDHLKYASSIMNTRTASSPAGAGMSSGKKATTPGKRYKSDIKKTVDLLEKLFAAGRRANVHVYMMNILYVPGSKLARHAGLTLHKPDSYHTAEDKKFLQDRADKFFTIMTAAYTDCDAHAEDWKQQAKDFGLCYFNAWENHENVRKEQDKADQLAWSVAFFVLGGLTSGVLGGLPTYLKRGGGMLANKTEWKVDGVSELIKVSIEGGLSAATPQPKAHSISENPLKFYISLERAVGKHVVDAKKYLNALVQEAKDIKLGNLPQDKMKRFNPDTFQSEIKKWKKTCVLFRPPQQFDAAGLTKELEIGLWAQWVRKLTYTKTYRSPKSGHSKTSRHYKKPGGIVERHLMKLTGDPAFDAGSWTDEGEIKAMIKWGRSWSPTMTFDIG